MRNSITLLLAIAMTAAAISTVQAQTPGHADRRQGRSSSQKDSNFYVKGPNAAFKNQQRKFTDPLNANGK